MAATSTADGGLSLATDSLSGLHWAGIALSAITGALHLGLGVSFITTGFGVGFGVAFILAGVGYLVGIAAVLVDYRRRLFYALGIPFTVVQIVAWYVVNAPDFSTTGIFDKVVQVALVAVLVILYRNGA